MAYSILGSVLAIEAHLENIETEIDEFGSSMQMEQAAINLRVALEQFKEEAEEEAE